MNSTDEFLEVINKFNDITFEFLGEACFSWATNSLDNMIQWNNFIVFQTGESDQGWDEDLGIEERTIEEQVIFEMKKLRNDLDNTIRAIEND